MWLCGHRGNLILSLYDLDALISQQEHWSITDHHCETDSMAILTPSLLVEEMGREKRWRARKRRWEGRRRQVREREGRGRSEGKVKKNQITGIGQLWITLIAYIIQCFCVCYCLASLLLLVLIILVKMFVADSTCCSNREVGPAWSEVCSVTAVRNNWLFV